MTRQRRCRICHERPPSHGNNCPPGTCKRCCHREIWVDRPAARPERLRAESAASTDPLADFAGSLVYDGYLGSLRPADSFSDDPLDLETIAVWEEENGVLWDRVGQRASRRACAAATSRFAARAGHEILNAGGQRAEDY
jgi:hypothetical protein